MSATIAGAFQAQCDVIADQVAHEFLLAARDIASDANSRGTLHSSGHMLRLDGAAAEQIDAAAVRIYGVLMRATAASRIREADIPEIQRAFESALRKVAVRIADEWSSRAQPIQKALSRNYPPQTQERKLEQAVRHYSAEITLEITARDNGIPPASTVINLSGNVANFQTGHGASATVNMVVDQSKRVELTTAIEAVVTAVKATPALKDKEKGEIVAVLDDVKTESAKPEPNKTRITGLLQGVAGALAAIRHAPEAAGNVFTAWDALMRIIAAG